jgi:hypothetical protein
MPNGLPKILPKGMRVFLEKGDLVRDSKTIGAVLTCLSIFRVFPTHVKPDLGTILSPFTGTVKTFDFDRIKLACSDLFKDIKISRPYPSKIIGGESSGPNGFKAAWCSGIDALAFIHNPRALFFLILYLVRTSSFLLLC